MMKKVLIALGIVLLLLGGAAWWAFSSLDFLVKTAVERYGPDILGVPVKLGEVKISAQNGAGAIRDLEIGNAPGFSAPRAVKVGTATLAVDPTTLTGNVVLVREISVIAPDITYEIGPNGKGNLEAIQRNIENYLKKSGTQAEGGKQAAPKSDGRKFIFERISIRNARVQVTNPLLKGGGLAFTLPDIELRDLGKSSGGITPSQAASIVVSTLVSRIAVRALSSGQLLQRGTEGAKEILRDIFKR
jgi:hypothetical protein